MTTSKQETGKPLHEMTYDELRAIDHSPEWQADIDTEEAVWAKAPVLPPCPSWCQGKPGHTYESTEFDNVTFVRYHSQELVPAVTGKAQITQAESNRAGEVTLAPAVISLFSESGCEDLSVGQARTLAGELAALADKLAKL